MALCRRCGNSYDVNRQRALACHLDDEDWELIELQDSDVLDDLVDAWHQSVFDETVGLEAVICANTRWTHQQYENWVRAGTPEDTPWPPDGLVAAMDED